MAVPGAVLSCLTSASHCWGQAWQSPRTVALAGRGRQVGGWSSFSYNFEPCGTPLPTRQLGEQLSVTQLKQQEILRGALQSKSLMTS